MNTVNGSANSGLTPPIDAAAVRAWRLHHILAALLMLVCLAAAAWVKPERFWSDKVGEPDLQAVVPKAFGDWVENPYGAKEVVDPQQEETIRAIYNNTIARGYIHKPTGRQVMLSLAYGKDQSRDTQLHPPEACYGSRGFRILQLEPEDIRVGDVTLPAMRMDAVLGQRHEFVTYWMRVGDQLARGSLQRNLVRMRFAARGYVADGLLFRVSEVTQAVPSKSYELQDEFLRALLAELAKFGSYEHFVGKRGSGLQPS